MSFPWRAVVDGRLSHIDEAHVTGTGSLKVAVIGTGQISEEHLKFLSRAADVRLVGVCDLSPALAQLAVDRFGAAAAYTDYKQMLALARPDVVHVLTPPHTHMRLVGDCFDAGAHVIVEKPVAATHAEFLEIWGHAQRAGRQLVEDHNYRFNENVIAIERMVAANQLGDIREVEVRMVLPVRDPADRFMDEALPHPSHTMPCGAMHEFISHLCYLVLRFVPRWQRAAVAWSKNGTDRLFKYDDLDALLIDGPTHARIRFSSDAAPPCFTLTLRGTRGFVETDLFQPYLRKVLPRGGIPQLVPVVNQLLGGTHLVRDGALNFKNKIMQKTPYEGLQTFLRETYDALKSGGTPPVTFDDMDRTSRLIDALLDPASQV